MECTEAIQWGLWIGFIVGVLLVGFITRAAYK